MIYIICLVVNPHTSEGGGECVCVCACVRACVRESMLACDCDCCMLFTTHSNIIINVIFTINYFAFDEIHERLFYYVCD